MSEPVITEHTERTERNGAVAIVTLNRPQARNAVDAATANALRETFLTLDKDTGIRVIVFTGAGDAFCAGWDLKTVSEDTGRDIAAPTGAALDEGGPMGPTRLQLSKPVIAAIEGPAVAGGMELALWCDLRIMAKSAFMGIYNRRWGVPLIDGGTARLPRLIGESRAMDLILTGRKIAADEAFAIGLANRLVEDGAARDVAIALAKEIAAFPPECLAADWKNARQGLDGDMQDALNREFTRGVEVIKSGESATGAGRFAAGKGRGGDLEISERRKPNAMNKMKLLLGLTTAIALTACGDNGADAPDQSAPATPSETGQSTGDTAAPAPQQTDNWADNAEFSKKSEDDTVSIEINTPKDVLSRDRALYERIYGEAEKSAEDFRKDAAEAKEAAQGEDYPYRLYSQVINWTAPFDNGGIVSLLAKNWEFTGGAHGADYFHTLTWNMERSQPVALKDIFKDESKTWHALSILARTALLQAKRERMAEYLDSGAEIDQMWMDSINDATAPKPESFELMTLVPSTEPGKAGGIKLYYPPYAVGAYAEGAYEIVLSHYEISDYIDPDWSALFSGEPVEAPETDGQ